MDSQQQGGNHSHNFGSGGPSQGSGPFSAPLGKCPKVLEDMSWFEIILEYGKCVWFRSSDYKMFKDLYVTWDASLLSTVSSDGLW